MDFLEEELHLPSIFVDEGKLSSQFVPDKLLHRTEHLKFLVRHFKGLFSDRGDSKKIIIYGKVGTGKTSIAKKFVNWAREREESKNKIRCVQINCRKHRKSYTILLTIARALNSHVPTRGFASQELVDMIIDLLEARKFTLLLILDEIDYVLENDLSNLIYSLTRTNDDRQFINHHISLILISRSLLFLEKLDDSTRSTLSPAQLYLEPYRKKQLEEILNERISQSFKAGAVSNEAVKLAAEIAGRTGDARLGLELIWYGGKYADQIGSSILYPDYIRLAKSNIEPIAMKRSLRSLGKHQLLVLLAITQQLKTTKSAYITTRQVKEAYHILCEEFEEEPRQHTQMWEYVKELQKLDLVVAELSGKGQRGKTQKISIEDVSAEILEEEVNQRLNQIIQK